MSHVISAVPACDYDYDYVDMLTSSAASPKEGLGASESQKKKVSRTNRTFRWREYMIDPTQSLAFSMQSNPGVFALLLGSGVSRAAGIPTGWEITLDLIRRLASMNDESCEPDPEAWYQSKFGTVPDYSDLLDQLAKTSAERQQLLRSYLEPNEQEREEGLKQPTLAHDAIAELAVQGYIRAVITTNFDRLLETAMQDAGITPTVLSSADQVQGALPLIHTQCCILKVHGDYLDTRIRNTPAELAEYPEEFDVYLDRIFDEFGLVVCGWSATWDPALRSAINRAASRRFTTYWAAHSGQLSDEAKQIVSHRQAQVISIDSADDFFQNIRENVASLEEFSRPHPLSREAAIISLKRYIPEPRHRIRLADLIDDTTRAVINDASGQLFDVQNRPEFNTENLTARLRAYEGICSTIMSMGVIGARWAEDEHSKLWQGALQTLCEAPEGKGDNLWSYLRYYPGMLLLYSLGIGALEAGNLSLLGDLFSTDVNLPGEHVQTAVQLLPPYSIFQPFDRGALVMQTLEGMDGRYYPLNDWLHETLREHTSDVIPSLSRHTMVFDRLEILLALNFAYRNEMMSDHEWYWAPAGSFAYRHQNQRQVIEEIEESLSTLGDDSPYVTFDLVGDFAVTGQQNVAKFKAFARKLRYR